VPEKNPAKTKRTKESLGKATAKSDVLQREQLESWFNNVKQIQNPMIAASIQVMLLTGARVNEVLDLKWEDINDRWKGMQLRDKIEGTREIPKTPYVSYLLANLPRRNEWVFSSPTSERGRLSVPNSAHTRACKAAGINGLTLQGLRRSFSTLTEWIETPSGIVAQIQGHKPSATAEKHYKVRPLELLRIHHTKIEAWILEQAQISFDPSTLETRLHLAKA
jgi:integrase